MKFKLFSLLAVALTLTTSAFATTLDLTTPAPVNQQYQQTENSPCVFGENSCKQPAGFDYTSIAFGGNTSTYGIPTALQSPTYTGQQIYNVIGSYSFIIGVDVNQAGQKNPDDDPYLTYFAEFISTDGGNTFTEVATFGTAGAGTGGTALTIANNGNGWADDLITNFVAPGANDQVYFQLSYYNGSDGSEEFFLINTSNPPPVVPEPSSLMLFGTGLLGMAGFLRRRLLG
jgi:hypothetical protein